MPILNTFSGGGGGIRIPLEAPTALSLAAQDKKVVITWTDPVDKVATPGGEMVAEWNYSIVVRNTERVPVSPKDGVEIVRTTSRNQYQSTGYVDELYVDNDVTYYYAVFAVTTIGVPSEPDTGSAVPTAATPDYITTITLPTNHIHEASLSATENHVLVYGGGYSYDNWYDWNRSLDAIDQSLTTSTIWTDSGTGSTWGFSTGQLNGYAFFSNGWAYNPSLTRSTFSASPLNANGIGMAPTKDYLIMAGCETDNDYDSNGKQAIAINTSMTKSSLGEYSDGANYHMQGATAGEYAVLGGGGGWHVGYDSDSDTVAFNNSLTRTTIGTDGPVSIGCGGATAGIYAIFGGGGSDEYPSNQVIAFNDELTRLNPTGLSSARWSLVGLTLPGFAMFAGGYNDGRNSTCDCYDGSLTKIPVPNLPSGGICGATPYGQSGIGGDNGRGASFGNNYGAIGTSATDVYIYQVV